MLLGGDGGLPLVGEHDDAGVGPRWNDGNNELNYAQVLSKVRMLCAAVRDAVTQPRSHSVTPFSLRHLPT